MVSGENNIQCPLCKKPNNEVAKTCHYCGTTLNSINDGQRSKPDTIIVEALSQDYEIIEIIGKGGMATVYKALHKRLDRVVALKVIHQNLIHDEDLVSRFINEARICASLNHRNIITVHDIGIISTVYFIAMEYLEGNDLFSVIRNKGILSVEDTLRFAIPVADALSYMHRLGFIHRDVKSSNIFITNDGRPVLMDFGIVHSNNGKTISTSAEILGTPEYMSPEQAAGNSEMDHRSDIYSFGVMLYEALTRQLPFRGENFLTTLHKVIHETPKPPIEINKKIPRWLNDLILSCLQKNKEQRIQSGEMLLNRLISEGKPVKGGKSKSEKVILVAIILVFVLLVSTAVYFIGFQQQDINLSTVTATNIATETPLNAVIPEFEGTLDSIDSASVSVLPPATAEIKTQGAAKPTENQSANVVQPAPKPAPPIQAERTTSPSENQVKPIAVPKPVEEQRNAQTVVSNPPPTVKPPEPSIPVGFRISESQMSNLSNLGITVVLVKAGNSQLSDFYIMQTEVTQALWESIMNSNPSMFKGRNKPVENIDLNDIQFFIQRLNTRSGLTFRLPTVQEWIYAASGGESSNNYTYSGGNIIDNIAWYEENARETMPVRQKNRNELGIFDMSGNVWERCQGNMMCGGSWLSPGNLCSVKSSRGVGASQKDYTIGFRLIVSN